MIPHLPLWREHHLLETPPAFLRGASKLFRYPLLVVVVGQEAEERVSDHDHDLDSGVQGLEALGAAGSQEIPVEILIMFHRKHAQTYMFDIL